MNLNILILGTSNSLLKGGWTKGIRKSLPQSRITNLSIGASPGIQFSALINLDFSIYDYVVFDSVPNDEDYQHANLGYSDLEFTTTILRDIFSTIALETNLLILGISTKRFLKDESLVYATRRALAYLCGGEFIDVRYILNKYSDFFISRSGQNDVYDLHPSHPLPEHMAFIGEEIGRSICSFPRLTQPANTDYRQYYTIWEPSSEAHPDLRVIEKKNSLIAERFAHLTEGDTLEFSATGRCLGFYANYCGTNALIALENRFTKTTRFISLFAKASDSLIKIFVPVPNGEIITHITISKPQITDAYTPTMFSNTPTDDTPALLQISQVVFSDRAHIDSIEIKKLTQQTPRTHGHVTQFISNSIGTIMNDKVEPPVQEGIVDHLGRTLFFNIKTNKCVALTIKTKPQAYKIVFPVIAKIVDNLIELYASVSGNLILLSAYPDGVSVSNAIMLSIYREDTDKIGSQFISIKQPLRKFSLLCEDKYVTSLPDGSVVCNRSEANAWELFTMGI